MRIVAKRLALLLLLVVPTLPTVIGAQTVSGSIDAAFAVGNWMESHEGVSIFCARVTTQKDVVKGNGAGVCFMTEAEAKGKDSVTVSTNTYAVTDWSEHGLSGMTEFYADKNGDQIGKSSPGAIKFTLRVVINFDTHQATKFVEASTGHTNGYHLANQ
jgi:hypothetical protein